MAESQLRTRIFIEDSRANGLHLSNRPSRPGSNPSEDNVVSLWRRN